MGTLECEMPSLGNPLVVSNDKLEAVILVPKIESYDIDPGEIGEEVQNICEKLKVDKSDVLNMLGPLFLADKYPVEPLKIDSSNFEILMLTYEEDIMEDVNNDEVEQLRNQIEELKQLNEELQAKNVEFQKENEEFVTKLEEIKYEQKLAVATQIADFRVKKGLLEKEKAEEKAAELAKLPSDILEELLEDVKQLSKRLSKPEPEVTGDLRKLSNEDKERLREELFGVRRD